MVFFPNNCQNVYEKQVIFKCFQNPRILRCQNKTLCNESYILVLFKKVILKWVGVPDFWDRQVKNRTKYRKMVVFPGLKLGIFASCLSHIRTLYFSTFLTKFSPLKSRKAPETLKNYFWTKFKQFRSFFTLSLSLFWG